MKLSRIYWDSMLFAYVMEGNPAFGPQVDAMLTSLVARGDTLCTSIFGVGEVLTGPRKLKDTTTEARLKSFFLSGVVEILPFTIETAERFAGIRAETWVHPGDAIHLASAALAKVDVFVTNDKQLQRLKVSGIQFIVGLDGKLF